LGAATSYVTAKPDGAYYQNYQYGSIYWTSANGAHEVHGLINGRYLALGGAAKLGYPATDETTPPSNTAVRYNDFNGYSIYWKSSTGTFEVHGDIRVKYLSLGGPGGFLGVPITDESVTPDTIGRYNHFENGSIYWTPQTGAHEVHGLIRERWKALGWEKSWLGYPTSDETTVWNYTDAQGQTSGRFNKFQGAGSIYYYPDTGAYEVHDVAGITQSAQQGEGLRVTTGTRNILTILFNPHVTAHDVNPADPDISEMTMPNKTDVERALFSGTSGGGLKANVRDFYTENTFGRLTLNNAGVLPTDSRQYYEPPSGRAGKHYWDPSKHSLCSNDGWISGHDERVADAIRAAAVDFDFKKYDTNNDGILTPEELSIIIVAPGKGGAWGDVRPAYGGYSQPFPCASATAKTLAVDGVTISNQFGAGRLEWFAPAPPSGQLELGLPAHELAHFLTGIPDLYYSDKSKSWKYDATIFSRMSAECTACSITHFDPWLKLKAGWLNYMIGTPSGTYTLRNVENYAETVILYDPARGPDEYFILEYRRPGTSYDNGRPYGGGSGLPNAGVAMWHIIENPTLQAKMNPPAGADNYYRKGVLMVRAAGGVTTSGASLIFNDESALGTTYNMPAYLYWSDGSLAFTVMPLDQTTGVTTPPDQVRIQVTR
jgi:M6 family metalloprotease-like protein